MTTLGLPSTAISQDLEEDSIAVIERGTPGIEGWDILEFPFRVATFPLYIFATGLGALSGVAERGHWIPWLLYYNEQLNDRGMYPSVGSQGPNSGTGAELLLGVRRDERFRPWGYVRGGGTVRRYWRLEARAGLAGDPSRHLLSVEGVGGIERRAEDEFFGIGNDTDEDSVSDFELKRYSFGGQVGVHASSNLGIELGAGWSETETGPGLDDRRPDVDSLFAPEEIPRFDEKNRYVAFGGSAGWGLGTPHSLQRRGLWVKVGYRWHDSRTDGAANFGRFQASGGVELPFDYRRRSVAVTLYYVSVRPRGGGELPFYELSNLGGTRTLPSFRSQRFRERDAILGKLEYRYRVWTISGNTVGVDAALFLNAGMVARSMSDEFRLKELHESYGLALRLITTDSAAGRLAFAHGEEGFRVTFSFGPTF